MNITKKNQATAKISCSFGAILCLISIIWGILLIPVAKSHTDQLIAFGFAAINILNQLFLIVCLLFIGVVAHQFVSKLKIEISRNMFFAVIGYIIAVISFLISVHELAILIFLALSLLILGIGRFADNISDLKLEIMAPVLYVAQVGVFILIFSLFCKDAENIIISALLITTYSMCVSTFVFVCCCVGSLMYKLPKLVKDEYIFNEVLISCLVVSGVLLKMYKGASNQLYAFIAVSVLSWICFKLCNYLKNKPNQKDKYSREN